MTTCKPIIGRLSVPLASLVLFACALRPPSAASPTGPAATGTDSALKLQAVVMDMADDYIAALGESVYLLTRSGELDSKGRWLAQSFLRNGVGASLDIAVGPNPAVNQLDLLVLASLQAWSFEVHWIPAGIGLPGRPALARLKRAEAEAWASAAGTLSEAQLRTLRELIEAWIKENPDRTVVALVRFDEFADARKMSSLSLRSEAQGLLKEVGQAVAAVDDARLLGERLLWFAGRYPYLLGEQTELTAYRLIDQPEGARIMDAIASLKRLSDVLAEQIRTLKDDVHEEQAAFFERIAAERAAAIAQLQEALQATVRESLDLANERVDTQRSQGIDQFFDRFARERQQLLDDLASRESEFLQLMTELTETISVSGALARDLTETVEAIDRVVARFDTDPNDEGEPLRMTDVRDAAIETGRAADRVTILLERAVTLLESESWDRRMTAVTAPADAVVDRLFWRGVVLIGLLILGLALLRLIPQRVKGPKTRPPES